MSGKRRIEKGFERFFIPHTVYLNTIESGIKCRMISMVDDESRYGHDKTLRTKRRSKI